MRCPGDDAAAFRNGVARSALSGNFGSIHDARRAAGARLAEPLRSSDVESSIRNSGFSSCSSLKELRSTEIDLIEPRQPQHFSSTSRRVRVLRKVW